MPAPRCPRALDFDDDERPVRTEDRVLAVALEVGAAAVVTVAVAGGPGAVPQVSQ